MENSVGSMFAFLPLNLEMANSKVQCSVSLLTTPAAECMSTWANLNACYLPAISGFSASSELLTNPYFPSILAFLCSIIWQDYGIATPGKSSCFEILLHWLSPSLYCDLPLTLASLHHSFLCVKIICLQLRLGREKHIFDWLKTWLVKRLYFQTSRLHLVSHHFPGQSA